MSLIWNNPRGKQFEPWLDEVRELGFDGVTGFAEDWGWAAELEDPAECGRCLAGRGLALASLDTMLTHDLDRYRWLCDAMARIPCPHLVVIGGEGTGDADVAAVAEKLNAIGGIARERGVVTSYHNRGPGTAARLADFVRVIERTDPELVAVMLDTGHATRDFEDVADVGRRATTFLERYGSRLRFLELKDWNPETNLNTPLGEGRCDWLAVFGLLRRHAYTGWVVIEQNGNDGLSRGREPGECARASLAFARRHLAD